MSFLRRESVQMFLLGLILAGIVVLYLNVRSIASQVDSGGGWRSQVTITLDRLQQELNALKTGEGRGGR